MDQGKSTTATGNMDVKEYKELFEGQRNPEVVSLRPSKYIIVDKKVLAESSEAFLAIKPLYIVSEMVKDSSKGQNNYYNYDIYPLEGVWSLLNKEEGFVEHSNIIGNFMIKQPDFLTEELFNKYKNELLKSSQNEDFLEYLEETNFRIIDEGKNIKMLHIGPYSKEQETFDIMEKFASNNNLKRKYDFHRESYIKDIRTIEPERFETILKFQVE